VILRERPASARQLYPYQRDYIDTLFTYLIEQEKKQNLLFQLPTGGGKTVIFSEIARRFIAETNGRILILTHRIELIKQTFQALEELHIPTKVIMSEVGNIEQQEQYSCFLAMVETLNNRLKNDDNYLDNISLVIVDEAHYNSFRKIFNYFQDSIILGVTATPLSSNQNLPLKENYDQLIIGDSIKELIAKGFLSDAVTYTYDLHLGGLKIGIDGDYTVSSLDRIYSSYDMQDRLISSYEQLAKGSKTLIFNSSVATSKIVETLFEDAGYAIRHLDSTSNKAERKDALQWFKDTPEAIITSVGILTTGFDEPTIETIMLNRATRSLTLYHQMIGRGSRRLSTKSSFKIIDLGNNTKRLGLWQDFMDWKDIFYNPERYLEYLQNRESLLDKGLLYTVTAEVLQHFPNTQHIDFDMEATCLNLVGKGKPIAQALEISLENHIGIISNNSEDYAHAMFLMKVLEDEIVFRTKVYTNCLSKATRNYQSWVYEDYTEKLKRKLRQHYA
jgi:superfamily II DNA or RNA helicase